MSKFEGIVLKNKQKIKSMRSLILLESIESVVGIVSSIIIILVTSTGWITTLSQKRGITNALARLLNKQAFSSLILRTLSDGRMSLKELEVKVVEKAKKDPRIDLSTKSPEEFENRAKVSFNKALEILKEGGVELVKTGYGDNQMTILSNSGKRVVKLMQKEG